MKKLLVLVLSLVTLVALTGCNGAEYGSSDYFKKGDVVSAVSFGSTSLSTSFSCRTYTVEDDEDYTNYYYYISSAIFILDVTDEYFVFQEVSSQSYKYDENMDREYYNTFKVKNIDLDVDLDVDLDDLTYDHDAAMDALNEAQKSWYSNFTTVEECYVEGTYLVPVTSINYMVTTDEDTLIFNQLKLNYTDYFHYYL